MSFIKENSFFKCWLDYKFIENIKIKSINIINNDNSVCSKTAVEELIYAFGLFTSEIVLISENLSNAEYTITLDIKNDLQKDEYKIISDLNQARIIGGDDKAILYGTFTYLRNIMITKSLIFNVSEKANCSFRMINHWDNMDGSIERGYSGESFFFKNDEIIINERTEFYAKLISSVGINSVCINNVNVRNKANFLISHLYYEKLNKLSNIFEKYGIKLFLSVNFSAPMIIGDLDTCDPLDKAVENWWNDKSKEIFRNINNFGGFVVKADSEGNAGPYNYNRNHADGANMLARSVKDYGGVIIWRCFVYNCKQDWRDKKTDRARAAYDNFMPLDSKFDENVILQIKNGPMDFQIREPINPLICKLKNTNIILELQIAQEYTGQQKDVCYLLPRFKEIVDFNTYNEQNNTISEIISNKKNFGIAAVTNTGDDFNWTGNYLAAANLYGFGKLAFNNSLNEEEIASEWIKLTFDTSENTSKIIKDILLNSIEAYEKYTVPLGIGWMCKPSHHYGVDIDGYEFDYWGTYHRADRNGLGIDRSENGTGYAMLYSEKLSAIYNSPQLCPDDLKLFFHHLPYNFRLKSGKTIIQHIYDTHFEGYELVEKMKEKWNSIKNELEPQVFQNVINRFEMQLKNAIQWRDVINTYFHRLSGINDEKGRIIY